MEAAVDQPPGIGIIGVGTRRTKPSLLSTETFDVAVASLRDTMDWRDGRRDYVGSKGRIALKIDSYFQTVIAENIASGKQQAVTHNQKAVETMEWVAVIDDKNEREIGGDEDTDCRTRDGMTVEDIQIRFGSFKAPPLHINCRCDIIPVITEWEALASDIEDEHARSAATPSLNEWIDSVNAD